MLAERLGEITVEPEDAAQAPTEEPGVIDVDDWTARRRAGSAHLTGRFCVVTAFETIAALRPRFAGIATGGLGLADFDAAALKDARRPQPVRGPGPGRLHPVDGQRIRRRPP